MKYCNIAILKVWVGKFKTPIIKKRKLRGRKLRGHVVGSSKPNHFYQHVWLVSGYWLLVTKPQNLQYAILGYGSFANNLLNLDQTTFFSSAIFENRTDSEL